MARKKSEDAAAKAPAKRTAKKKADTPTVYTAVIGDCLFKVALKTGIDILKLKELNPTIKMACMPLKLGQVVRLE